MKIVGGEPPFIDNPEPRFGGVVIKLNELSDVLQKSVGDANTRMEDMLQELSTSIDTFVGEFVVPMDQHFNAVGPVHGETKVTVGLGNKDNFRTATIAEHVNLADVNAWVVPAGVKASVAANNQEFISDAYQQNFLFQFASYFHQNLYPLKTLTRPEPIRYYEKNSSVGVLLNNDRLIFSPFSNRSVYEGQNIHASLATKVVGKGRLSEITNLENHYPTNGWNVTGVKVGDNRVAIFKTIADKNIYDYKSELNIPPVFQNFLLNKSYGSSVYKGVCVGATVTSTDITLHHKFFSVDSFETDPTLKEVVSSAYQAVFTSLGVPAFTGPANGSHGIKLSNYITVPAGATAVFDTTREPVVTLVWDAQDVEFLLHVVAPVTVTRGAVSTRLYLEFVERVRPGTLATGGSATFTQINRGAKDNLNNDLLPATSNWIKVNDKKDFSNPVYHPGAFLNSGEIVKAKSTKFGLLVKRFTTKQPGIKTFLTGTREKVDLSAVHTQLFTPARHSPFSSLPERILPVAHVGDRFTYLVYGLNGGTGLHEWNETIWGLDTLVSTASGNKFGVMMPTGLDPVNVPQLPKSVISIASKTVNGVTLSSLAFTPHNNYKTTQTLAYANGVVTVSGNLELDPGSQAIINAAAREAAGRAVTVNPAVDNSTRAPQSFVFRMTPSKALIIVTDGVNYAEAGVTNFKIANGYFTLDFTGTTGLRLTRVTPVNQSVTGKYRESNSKDEPWFDYSDLLCLSTGTDSYDIVLTRAFGNLYGDISFSVTGLTALAPAFTAARLNAARLYDGVDQIDTVNELIPPILIPRKGLYIHDNANTDYTTIMREVSGASFMDLFDINQTGWVRVPAGGRVVLWGGSFILDKEYAVQAFPTGKTYCYLVRQGLFLSILSSNVIREPSNNEAMFGVVENGILTLNKSYIVMDDKLVSSSRKGATVPYFPDDGNLGVNTFFTKRDIVGN